MSGNKLALDTNIVIALLNGDQTLWQWLQKFDPLSLPVPVVGELIFGAENSQQVEKNLYAVQNFVDRSRIMEITANTARVYGKIRTDLKNQGTPIPENDVWIAALCLEEEATLVSLDKHFSSVAGLQIKTKA